MIPNMMNTTKWCRVTFFEGCISDLFILSFHCGNKRKIEMTEKRRKIFCLFLYYYEAHAIMEDLKKTFVPNC